MVATRQPYNLKDRSQFHTSVLYSQNDFIFTFNFLPNQTFLNLLSEPNGMISLRKLKK